MNAKKFTPGWPGMKYDVVPGNGDCSTCRNTGFFVMLGAPRRGDGSYRFDYPCECGRDPIRFLHDEIARKNSELKSSR